MQFAKSEGWNQVISEGDAKSCFGAISSPHSDPDWDISNVISNILSFKVIFSSCNFRWVNRDCNGAAHAAAKLSLRSSESLFYDLSLPEGLKTICEDDCSFCSPF